MLTILPSGQGKMLHMTQVARIHSGKTPQRIHYIAEWTAHRNLKQADLVRNLPVDKSTVSRWFGGSLPKEEHLRLLAEFLHTDVPGLFRHPDDDWIARMLRDRSDEERTRIVQIIKLSVPRTGTDG